MLDDERQLFPHIKTAVVPFRLANTAGQIKQKIFQTSLRQFPAENSLHRAGTEDALQLLPHTHRKNRQQFFFLHTAQIQGQGIHFDQLVPSVKSGKKIVQHLREAPTAKIIPPGIQIGSERFIVRNELKR
ncbi:hypothetical protein AC781_06720 [Akkermansia glycaniphila]|nr:hypothetical protein AC781_06720 [Akkermansia glycaniphila]